MGLLFCEEKERGVLMGVWRIEETEEELMSKLTMSNHYRGRWQSLSALKRRKEYLCTRIIAKRLLGEEVEINYTAEGAPILRNGWKISVSHAQSFVAVIIGKDRNVAIDIEQISSRAFRNRERFLSESELQLLSSDTQNEDYISTLLWSAKECLYKLSDSPLKAHYKDQIRIRHIVGNELIGDVWESVGISIHHQTLENYVLAYIIS